jgi:Ca2+-binding EF-hand superfamily protein
MIVEAESSDSAPTLPHRNCSPRKPSDDRFLADSSGHSSSGHGSGGGGGGGGRRSSHGSPTKPSRTSSERGGNRRASPAAAAPAAAPTAATATAAKPSKPSSTEFARQTRHDLHQQILLAQEKLKLVEDVGRMTTSEKLDCLFRLIDGDGSGTVDAQELAAILRLRNSNLTERESLDRAANMVSAFDADGNAELDQDEFRTFISTMLDQLQLDPDEFVEFLIFHIAYPEPIPSSKDDEPTASQQPRQSTTTTTTGSSPRRSAATKSVPTRSRPSPRPSVSSACSGSTVTTANETIVTASSLSTTASASTSLPSVVSGEAASPSSQPHARSGHPPRTAVVSIPKRVRNVGGATGGGGGDVMRRRMSANMHHHHRAAVAPGHSTE